MENIWQYIDYEAILDAGCEAWNKLLAQPETIKSIGMRECKSILRAVGIWLVWKEAKVPPAYI